MSRRDYPRVAAALAGGAQPAAAQSSGAKSAVPGSQFSGTAQLDGPFPTLADAEADGYVDEAKAGWRDYVYQAEDGENEDEKATWYAGERYKRMEELKVTSKAMGGREIPVVTIKAKNNPETAPTLYLLNGADGGEGGANWLKQTSAVDFYGNRSGDVNVVIPIAGAYSYYTDWQSPAANLDTDAHGVGTTQKWETFLTQELPGPVENHLGHRQRQAGGHRPVDVRVDQPGVRRKVPRILRRGRRILRVCGHLRGVLPRHAARPGPRKRYIQPDVG